MRPAEPDDLSAIVAHVAELAAYEGLADQMVASEADFGRWLFGPDPKLHASVATSPAHPDVVAGVALWYPTFSTFLGRPGIWLEDLYVRPAHRNQGLARALLDHLRSLTDGRVEWAVLDWNEPAVGLYRSLGAEPVDGWTIYRWLPDGGGPP